MTTGGNDLVVKIGRKLLLIELKKEMPLLFGVFSLAAARVCFFPPFALQKVVGFLTANRGICCKDKLSAA